VDGTEGTAVIRPDAQTLQERQRTLEEEKGRNTAILLNELDGPTLTRDGVEVTVMANVRSREDVEHAMESGAAGIGLFRTEPFFLSTKHFPSDREFEAFLLHSLAPVKDSPSFVRLLDIGADKNPVYLHLPPEPDPFLGRRGLRVLREYPALLEAQLRAMLMVSREFQIGVLIPMVTMEKDVIDVVTLLHRLALETGVDEVPQVGAMIETPAAALSIPTLRKHVDFFSIGSNDLTQYTMAAGRENPLVADYFVDDHPAIRRLIELVVTEAGSTPVSLCGELAGRIEAIPSLLRAGIRSFSVSAGLVGDVKNAIRRSNV
jgi:phosphoenolpyruvate-protein kinase (PTS system EI component)